MTWKLRAVSCLVRALLGLKSKAQPSVYTVRAGALLVLEQERDFTVEEIEARGAYLRSALAGLGLRVLVLTRGVRLAGVVDVSVPAPGSGAERGES